jgi:beta-glucuronidase
MVKRISLAGWWQIKFDEKEQGEQLGWASVPPQDCRKINVPSCWNEVFPDYFNYEGTAWYFKQVFFPPGDLDERVMLCFEGVNYRCQVFVNGRQSACKVVLPLSHSPSPKRFNRKRLICLPSK